MDGSGKNILLIPTLAVNMVVNIVTGEMKNITC